MRFGEEEPEHVLKVDRPSIFYVSIDRMIMVMKMARVEFEDIYFRVDRPSYFMIKTSDAILFQGQLVEPTF
ncbi:hypothetical protein TKK_0006111 [Trichogramma kaykai]